jgi:hypothetical protein
MRSLTIKPTHVNNLVRLNAGKSLGLYFVFSIQGEVMKGNITILASALALAFSSTQLHAGYEVWLSDQANTQNINETTPNGTHGGKIRIYDSADIGNESPLNAPLVLDATADLFPNAKDDTGKHVSRIHGILPSHDHRYMALNFVASGHVGIVDGESKEPACLFRTTGTSTGRQNHMSFWTADGDHLIVANQKGKMLERIDVARNNSGDVDAFQFNANASLDLVGGAGRVVAQPIAVDMNPDDNISCSVTGSVADNQSTLTPAGNEKQHSELRPNNAVICPIPTQSSQHAFVTLGGGGLFVVDNQATPMAIVAEYDKSLIAAAGCGGVEASGYMHINSGTSGANVSEFSLYRLSTDLPVAPGFQPANTPAIVTSWHDEDNGKVMLKDSNRDAHGLIAVRNVQSGDARYIHQMDRVRNNVEVFKMAPPWNDLGARHEGSYDLTSTGVCGATLGAVSSNDPAPDLGDLSPGGLPEGGRMYVALRGPYPLSVSHAAQGSCPGLGIITLSADRRSGELTHVLDTSVDDFTASKNLSDPHAVVVRRKTN